MSQPIVFFDIAGEHDVQLKAFYSAIFGWDADQTGQFSVDVMSPIKAAIRNDPAEHRIYVGVPDVAATLADIETAGGSVDVSRFEVLGVVVLGLFKDPAGNPMGLVEMDGAEPRIP